MIRFNSGTFDRLEWSSLLEAFSVLAFFSGAMLFCHLRPPPNSDSKWWSDLPRSDALYNVSEFKRVGVTGDTIESMEGEVNGMRGSFRKGGRASAGISSELKSKSYGRGCLQDLISINTVE